MGLVYTTEEIDADLDAAYGPLTIPLGEAGNADLLNMLRLPKAKRAQFKAKLSEFNKIESEGKELQRRIDAATAAREAGEDVEIPDVDDENVEKRLFDLVGELLAIVCADPKIAKVLLTRLPSLPHRMLVIRKYMSVVQAGEASTSPS